MSNNQNNQSRSFITNNNNQQNIKSVNDLINFNGNNINLNTNPNVQVNNPKSDIRTFANIGTFQKPTQNKESQADQLKQQMEEAKAKKERQKEELRKEDEKLLKMYENLPDKEVKTSIKIVSRDSSPEVRGLKSEPDVKYTLGNNGNPNAGNKVDNSVQSSYLNIGSDSQKMENERNSK